jgi:hypothetical protein
MRALAALVVLGVVSALPPAFAETWRTKVRTAIAATPNSGTTAGYRHWDGLLLDGWEPLAGD